MNTLFDRIVGRLEEHNHVIEDTGVVRTYDTGAIYTHLPSFTRELIQKIPFAECVAYQADLTGSHRSIEVGVSYGDTFFLLVFTPGSWEKGEPAEVNVVELDLFEMFEHVPAGDVPPKVTTIVEYAKTTIEQMNEYRLHAVTGKGWRWS